MVDNSLLPLEQNIENTRAIVEMAHGCDIPVEGELGYVAGVEGEDAQRRLAQRREALYPWVDENTYIVTPDETFDAAVTFTLGGIRFELTHLGPAHAPGDTIMLVRDYGVLFSGDTIYEGRIPFLDSPETDTRNWLKGLGALTALQPPPRYVIPGHGDASNDISAAVSATRNYIEYVRDAMQQAVPDTTDLRVLECHINDDAFSETVLEIFDEWVAQRVVPKGVA